jgi:hypothetical protein
LEQGTGNREQEDPRLRLVASHPFARKKAKGWGTGTLWKSRSRAKITRYSELQSAHPAFVEELEKATADSSTAVGAWYFPNFARMTVSFVWMTMSIAYRKPERSHLDLTETGS